MSSQKSHKSSAPSLDQKKCVPCEGGVERLGSEAARQWLKQLSGWKMDATPEESLVKEWQFKNFAKALEFLNQVGAVAEKEGHHPDLYLYSYKKVRISIWTHAIGGLSENDFILAAKIDALPWLGENS